MERVSGLTTLVLHNNQGVDFKAAAGNQEHPYSFPLIALSFVGGEWELQSDRSRQSNEYIFELHVYQILFSDEHTGSTSQADALEHLDFLDQVINALDDWTGARHVERFLFQTEALDEDRTQVVEHVLQFQGKATDSSLNELNEAATERAVAATQEIIRAGQSQLEPLEDFNEVVQYDNNPYRI